jgi:hypothetical protein
VRFSGITLLREVGSIFNQSFCLFGSFLFVCSFFILPFVSFFFLSFGRLFVPLNQSTLLTILLLLLGGLHDSGDSCCDVLGYGSLLYSRMRVLKFIKDMHLLLHVLVLTLKAAFSS